jgi:hypothetical protein
MVISCSIFQLHIFKRQIYANILDASHFPHTTNYRTTNKEKTILCRLKAIDANKKPTTHLLFRRKLVEVLSADRMAVWVSKKQGRPFSNYGAKRLDGKQHFVYANGTAIPKTVQCVQIAKSRVGIMKLCVIAQHTPANLDLIPEIVLNYTVVKRTGITAV